MEDLGEKLWENTDLTALTATKMPTCWLCTDGCRPRSSTQAQQDAYTRATTARSRDRGLPTLPYSSRSLLRTWSRYWSQTLFQLSCLLINNHVIQETLDQYDIQAQKGMAGIGSLAAKSGNLGGGREGVMRSEYQNKSDLQ